MLNDAKVLPGMSKDFKCGYGWMRTDYGEVRIVTFICQ